MRRPLRVPKQSACVMGTNAWDSNPTSRLRATARTDSGMRTRAWLVWHWPEATEEQRGRTGMGARGHLWRMFTAVALALTVVTVPGTGAGARSAAKPTIPAKGKAVDRPARVAGAVYSQRDDDNGVAVVSQHFEKR